MTNHLRPSWILLALIILAVPNTGAIADDSSSAFDALSQSDPQLWPQACMQAKAKLSESSSAFVTFTPTPKPSSNVAAVWRLDFQALNIPVPAAQYHHITVWNNSHGFLLGLSFDDDQSFLILYERDPNLKSSNPAASASDGTNLTANSTNILQALITRGFTITPKDLTCSIKSEKQDKLDIVAIMQKTAALLTLRHVSSVHRAKHLKDGIMMYGHASETADVYAYLWDQWPGPQVYIVQYQFSKNRPYLLETGLLLANPEDITYASPPTWFQRLQTWIDKPTQVHWCALSTALKQAHFDPKDVRHLAKQHPACQSPQP